MYLEHPQALEVFARLIEQASEGEKRGISIALNASSDDLTEAFINFPHHAGFPSGENLTVEDLKEMLLHGSDSNLGEWNVTINPTASSADNIKIGPLTFEFDD